MNVVDYDNALDIAKAINKYIKIKDWVASTAYIVGQYVNNDGVLYKCTTANNDATFDPTNWQKVAGGGLDEWEPSTLYSVDDVIIYNNKIYQCNTAHTSGATFLPDEAKWTEISACITRIPNWVANEDYVVGDLVAHDAKIYRCTTAHTSGSTFDSTEEAKWEELSPTINEISSWAVSTDYAVGQLVIHDNKLYKCNTAHTSDSTSFNTDIAYWDLIGSSGIDAWKTGELYQQGSMVVYNDKIYVCDSSHTSANPFDYTKWHEVSSTTIEDWQANTEYVENQPIEYNDTLFRANKDFTSGTTVSDDDNNLDFVYANLSTWQSGVYYRQGAIVIDSDDKIYKCKQSHTSSSANRDTNWEELSKTLVEEYAKNKNYVEGAPVLYNGKLYRANIDVTNSTATLDPNKWDNIVGSGIEQWQPSTDYSVGNVIVNNNQIYICTNSHTSDSSDFSVDIANWQELDVKWEAIEWLTNTLYLNNEVVLYDNRLFRCINTHTSTSFSSDAINWAALSASIELWKPNIYYHIGDIVIDSNKLYRCIVAHNSSNTYIINDIANWEKIVSSGFSDWASNNSYIVGDFVIYNNKIYKCTTAHTSGNNFDYTKWQEISSSDIPLWASSTEYTVGNDVIYDSRIYRCITAHTSIATFDNSKFVEISPTKFDDYVIGKVYAVGDIVLYQKRIYKCNTVHTSSGFPSDVLYWTEVSGGGITQFTSGYYYAIGDIVIYSNKLYRCTTAHTSVQAFNTSNWIEISKNGIDYWVASNNYSVNDMVIFDNQLYVCSTAHTSNSSSFYSDYSYWNIVDKKWIANGFATNTLYREGEVVLYDETPRRRVSTGTSGSSFEADKSNWTTFNANIRDWVGGTSYKVGDTVIYNNDIWQCVTDNSRLAFKKSEWQEISRCKFGLWKPSPDPNVLALLHFDISGYPQYNEYGNDFSLSGSGAINRANGKFNYSYDIRNSNAGRTIKSPSYSFNNGEIYTIEFWLLYHKSPIHWSDNSGVSIVNIGQVIAQVYTVKYFPNTTYEMAATGFNDDAWNHMAYVFTPTDFTIYVNGNQIATLTRQNSSDISITINTNSQGMAPDSKIDELLVCRGAKYTSSFSVPTKPYDNPNMAGYLKDDFCVYDNKIYRALVDNNDSSFISSKWKEISECVQTPVSSLIPAWSVGSSYSVGDIVEYNNFLYRIVNAIGNASITPDNSNDYQKLCDSGNIQLWAVSTNYSIGDIVIHDNKLYRCNTTHTSDPIQFDSTEELNWDEISPTIDEITNWSTSTNYSIDQLVINDNKLYRCNTSHTSDSTSFNNDVSNWDLIGSSVIESWTSNKAYTIDSVVIYDNNIYKCNNAHISTSTFNVTNWDKLVDKCIDFWKEGNQYELDDVVLYNSADKYDPSNTYSIGDIVKVGNVTYEISNNTSVEYDLTSVNTNNLTVTVDTGVTATVTYGLTTGNIANIMDSSLSTGNNVLNGDYITITFSSPVIVDLVDIYGGQQQNAGYTVSYVDINGNNVSTGYKHLYPSGSTNDATYSSGWAWYKTPICNTVRSINIRFTSTGNAYSWTSLIQIKVIKSAYNLSPLRYSLSNFYQCITANNDNVFDIYKWQKIGGNLSSGTSIQDWTSGSNYSSGDLVRYNNIIYTVVNNVTNASVTPDNSSEYSQMSGFTIASNNSVNNLFI